jgi:PTS system mannose-specific IIB component
MTMGVPSSYKTHILTTEEAKKLLTQESGVNRLVIVKFPGKLEEIKSEIENTELIILGNLAKREDTVHKVSGATGIFYLSDRDVSTIDGIVAKGLEVCFQQLPSTTKTSWEAFKKTI